MCVCWLAVREPLMLVFGSSSRAIFGETPDVLPRRDLAPTPTLPDIEEKYIYRPARLVVLGIPDIY